MTSPLTIPVASSITKSDVVSDLDSGLRRTAGQGGAGRVVSKFGTALVSATLATTAGVRLVRIPSNAIVKSIKVGTDKNGLTFTTLTGCLGLVYSDNPNDGTPPLLAGTSFACGAFAATTGAGFAMASVALDVMLDVTYKAQLGVSTFTDGFYTISSSEMPIWLAIAQGGPGPKTPGAWAGWGAAATGTPGFQLTADPGGFFDVFFQPTTTTSVTGAFQMSCEAQYVE